MDLENTNTLEDWDKWKDILGRAVNLGQAVGISEDNMSNMAARIGDFLSNNVDPENHEQRLLKELWDEGTEEEKQTLAKLIIRMID